MSDRCDPIIRLNGGIDRVVLMRRSVIVAEGDDRTQFKRTPIGSLRDLDIVFDYSRILAVSHEDTLRDFNALNAIYERWERIQAELGEIMMSLRVNRSRILVR